MRTGGPDEPLPANLPVRMSEAIFRAEGDHFLPTEHARGPWDPAALHGGAPAALMVGALEDLEGGGGLAPARITFEFLRPVPLGALSLLTRVIRGGRRVQRLEAELSCGDQLITTASARRVAPVPADAPVATERALAAPEHGSPAVFSLSGSSQASFAATAMEMRWLVGEGELGPSTVWMRLRFPVVEGRATSPLMSLAAVADFGNGVGATLPFAEWVFINADLSIHLHRRPEGEWIGLESRTFASAGGYGLAESVLHDRRGPVGRASQSLVVQRR